jgi:hypothetical protein
MGESSSTYDRERREAHRVLVGGLEEKRPLGRHEHRWEEEEEEEDDDDDNNNNNNNIDLQETEWRLE